MRVSRMSPRRSGARASDSGVGRSAKMSKLTGGIGSKVMETRVITEYSQNNNQEHECLKPRSSRMARIPGMRKLILNN
jgi:hypothetical protein